MKDEEIGERHNIHSKESIGFVGAIISFFSRIFLFMSSFTKVVSLETKARKAKYIKRNLKRNTILLGDAIDANDRYIQELNQKIRERHDGNQMTMAIQLFKERRMREKSSCFMAEGRTSMIKIELDMSRAIMAEHMSETYQDYENFSGVIDPKKIEERAKSLKEIQDNQDAIWTSVQKEIAKLGSGNLTQPEVNDDDDWIEKEINEMMKSSSKKEEEYFDTKLRERSKSTKNNPEEEVSFTTLLDD